MPRHNGCFICGSTKDETLISIPDLSTMSSVALCRECHAKPTEELGRKIKAIRIAIDNARKAANV